MNFILYMDIVHVKTNSHAKFHGATTPTSGPTDTRKIVCVTPKTEILDSKILIDSYV